MVIFKPILNIHLMKLTLSAGIGQSLAKNDHFRANRETAWVIFHTVFMMLTTIFLAADTVVSFCHTVTYNFQYEQL